MLKRIITEATQAVHGYFEPEQTNQAARQSGWMQRLSKLDGFLFLKLLVMGFIEHPHASLNQLSQVGKDLGVEISPQGIDERLTDAAIEFLKERLTHALRNWQAKRRAVAEVLDQFQEVYFQDSSVQSLPEALGETFPGAGGNASSAAVKIQLLFAFLSGNIAHLSFESGRSGDADYEGYLPQVLPGSLLIQDLGFFNLAFLRRVAESLAFFLTRWRSDVLVFAPTDPAQPLDMPHFLQAQREMVASYEVEVGARDHLSARVVCVHLPETIAAQRRRRLKADGKRRGKAVSARSLALCAWNIFLTNLPEDRLSLHQILACYSLRWQVELIFKLWKSQAALSHLAGLRKARVLCELYAKMIGVILTHFLLAPLRFCLLDQRVELSVPKARQVIEDRAKYLVPLLGTRPSQLRKELKELVERLFRFARKNRRVTSPSSLTRVIDANLLEVSSLYA